MLLVLNMLLVVAGKYVAAVDDVTTVEYVAAVKCVAPVEYVVAFEDGAAFKRWCGF